MNTAAQSMGILSFEAAYEVVREHCRKILLSGKVQSEEVPLLQSLGRVLAESTVADRDFPPFPRATRDGFAIRAQDLKNGATTLRVVGQVRAGDTYDLPVASGEAVEIMTGAAVPSGADAVVMVEYTERKISEINHNDHEETQRKAGADEIDDDRILEIDGVEKRAQENKRVEDLVEILRSASVGENIVPAGPRPRQDRSYCRAEPD